MIVSAEQNSNPQWMVPDDDSVKGLSGRAGAVIKWRATNPSGRPERLQTNGDPGIAAEMYQMHDEQLKRMFFNHLFRPLEDYRNMTATEVNERMTTDMMSLAPFVARYLDEHVSPMMEHVFYILQKKGQLPPPPAELSEDPNYEIDYVGRLALATKSFESLGAIQTARIFLELGQGDPEFLASMDYLNKDKMFVNTYFSNSGSMDALNDEDDVDAKRKAQAQAVAKQQAIDNLAPTADAVQKLSGKVDPESAIAQLQG